MKRTVSFILLVCFLLLQLSGAAYALFGAETDNADFALTKTDRYNIQAKAGCSDSEKVRITVQLAGTPALGKKDDLRSSSAYRKKLLDKQENAKKKLSDLFGHALLNTENYTLLFNGFSYDGTAGDVDVINRIKGMRAFVTPSFEQLQPCTHESVSLVGAPFMWEADYSGKNTVIAVLDTGIRASHEAFSVNPPSAKYTKEILSEKTAQNSAYLHCGTDTDGLFVSGKVPFLYNYVKSEYISADTSDTHGTHVAGIAAGNNGRDFRGIAYDAQIFAMKVFESPTSGTTMDCILAALEDCVYLDVDVINMSFGSPCGTSAYADEVLKNAFSLIEKAGISVAASAGNSATTSKGNRWTGLRLTQNPDYGLASYPSTYYPCVSVASSDNRIYTPGYLLSPYFSALYTEPMNGTTPPFITLTGMREYMYCGDGEEGDFPAQISGRIALIDASDAPYDTIAENAEKSGAVGVVLIRPLADEGWMNTFYVNSDIPFVSLPFHDGENMLNHMYGGIGEIEVVNEEFNGGNDVISSFSSCGTTSDLSIKPEITAPGGYITSADGQSSDTAYAEQSGTSMAVPHIAGGMAVIREYLHEKMPDLAKCDIPETVNAVLLSSAKIMHCSFVTMQGAGIMDLRNALRLRSYLTVNGKRPLLELGESENYTWEFDIDVTNFSDEAVTYKVIQNYVIPTGFRRTVNGISVNVDLNTANNVTSLIKREGDSTVTVNAGETKTLHFAIDASDVTKGTFGSVFPNGTTLEGYIVLVNGKEKISAPLLGFLGDWDRASMFDRGFYTQRVTGEDNMQNNGSACCEYNYIGTKKGTMSLGIGFNPFVDTKKSDFFNPDWGAISPDGDGICDYVDDISFGALRTFREFYIDVQTPSGVKNLYTAGLYEVKKDYCENNEYTYHHYESGYAGEGLKEGETAVISVWGTLGHEGFSVENNECARWDIPVTLDTTPPVVTIKDGVIAVFDEHYVACAAVYEDIHMQKQLSIQGFFPEERGTTEYIDTLHGIVYLMVGDYAGNTAFYRINTGTDEIQPINESDKYTLRYMADDKVYAEYRLFEGEATIIPKNPEKEGYEFSHWDIEIPEKMPAHDITAHAVFVQNITVGDVNGDGKINTADAVFVLKYAAGMIQLDEKQLTAGDCNRDGNINTADAVLILKYAAGMISL